MLPCHEYQRRKTILLAKNPISNWGCKEDPAKLGDIGAINMDVNDYDPQEQLSLYQVPNFIRGSAVDPPFPDDAHAIVVIGELLEHCPVAVAGKILLEAHRVLREDGNVVITVPQDARPKHVQHAPHHLITWEHGITSWHQTVWTAEMFSELVNKAGFVEMQEHHEVLNYPMCQGFGAVLRKK